MSREEMEERWRAMSPEVRQAALEFQLGLLFEASIRALRNNGMTSVAILMVAVDSDAEANRIHSFANIPMPVVRSMLQDMLSNGPEASELIPFEKPKPD